MSIEHIRHQYKEVYSKAGYTELPDYPVVSDDPSVLFINSGYAALRDKLDKWPTSGRLFGTQTCIRMQGFDKVGDGVNYTSFRMMGSWIRGEKSENALEESARLAVEYLGKIGIKLCDINVAYYGGNPNLNNIDEDIIAKRNWSRYVTPEQMIPLGTDKGVWGPPGPEGPVGYRTGIQVDFGEGRGFKEIWNVSNFLDEYQDLDGKRRPIDVSLLDSGIGLERTASVIYGKSVYQCDPYKDVYSDIYSDLKRDEKSLRKREAIIVLDHIKTARLILKSGVEPGPRGKNSIPRRLLRRVASIAIMQGIDYSKTVSDWSAAMADVEHKNTMHTASDDIVQALIEDEMHKMSSIEKSLINFETLIETKGESLSALEIFKAHTTNGISLDIIKDMYSRNNLMYPEDEVSSLLGCHKHISRG